VACTRYRGVVEIPGVRHVESLAALPIELAEAIYSPDFVELSSISPAGTPLSLPMSFTLDVPGNCVRFSSPLTAGRLANYARDPRCSVLFSRVTSGYPPVLLQGTVTLGEVVEGNQRGAARRFTVTPWRLMVLDAEPQTWQFPGAPTPHASAPPAAEPRRARTATPPAPEDLAALTRFPSNIATLRDAEGWPVALPVEFEAQDGALVATLPELPYPAMAGRAAALGHTWSKAGPRYLALTGRADLDGDRLTFHPAAAMRRPA
jgi:hypothetical protein